MNIATALAPQTVHAFPCVCLLVSKMPLLFNGNGYLISVSSSFIEIIIVYLYATISIL